MTHEQGYILEILKIFSKICDTYHLRYYLAGGTLLGAIRHQGFIPWDDDIDVIMPLEDYQDFLQLQSALPSNLLLDYEEINLNYPFFFAELCNIEIPFNSRNANGPKGVYMDIFPIISSYAPTKISCFCFNIISIIGYVLQVKTGWTKYIPYKKWYAKICYKLLAHLPIRYLRKLRKILVQMLTNEKTIYCFSPGGGHKGIKEFYLKDWFKKVDFVNFENERFPIPSGWNQYLEQLYGDYMILPEKSHRKTLHRG